jgi:hypothetical protein
MSVLNGAGASSFSLIATGYYTLANGVLRVQLNGEVASTPFPSMPRTDYIYTRLSQREQVWARAAIYLPLTNEALGNGQIGLCKVSKFKFE